MRRNPGSTTTGPGRMRICNRGNRREPVPQRYFGSILDAEMVFGAARIKSSSQASRQLLLPWPMRFSPPQDAACDGFPSAAGVRKVLDFLIGHAAKAQHKSARECARAKQGWSRQVGCWSLPGPSATSLGARHENSNGLVEVAVNQGRADRELGCDSSGDRIAARPSRDMALRSIWDMFSPLTKSASDYAASLRGDLCWSTARS